MINTCRFHILPAIVCMVALFPAGIVGGEQDSAIVAVSERITRLLNIPGVSLGMAVQSECISSSITIDNPDTLYTRETEAFTQGDLLFVGRPVPSIAASAVLRLRSDWASFYSHPVDLVTTRWVSVDGSAGSLLDFHIGDYRSEYTPFTIGISQPPFRGEPSFMREQRRRELREYFIAETRRPLEGIMLDFHAAPARSLDIGLNAQGARLASVDGIDSKIFDRTAFDRLLAAVRPTVSWRDMLRVAYTGIGVFDLDATNYNTNQYVLNNTVHGGEVSLGGPLEMLSPVVAAARLDIEYDRSK